MPLDGLFRRSGVSYSTTEYTENTERAKGGDPLGSNGAQEGGEKPHRVGVLKAQARQFGWVKPAGRQARHFNLLRSSL